MDYNSLLAIERTVLSSFLYEPKLLENSLYFDLEFYLPANQAVFEAMLLLQAKNFPIDEEFLKRILVENSKFDEEVLLYIMSANPVVNIVEYINIVREASFSRKFTNQINQLKYEIEGSDSAELIQKFELSLESLKNKKPANRLFDIESTADIEAKLPEFYLKDILPIQKKEITILSAKGGSGKSYLGLYILALLTKEEKLKVFGYFSEDEKGITKNRYESLNEIHNLKVDIDIIGKESRPLPFIKYDKAKNLMPTEFFFKFKQQLSPYDVILIDPLIAFIADDENSNTEARFFMNLLNEWCEKEDKTLIMIHHHVKGIGGGVRGAGAFIDAVRLHYTVNQDVQETAYGKFIEDEKSLYRILKLEKTNHYTGPKEFKIKLFKAKYVSAMTEYKEESTQFNKIQMPIL